MNEFEEKLESILGNPQAMEQIMSLAQSLSGGNSASPPPSGPSPSPGPSPSSGPSAPPPSSPPPGGKSQAEGDRSDGIPGGFGLGQMDPRILSGVAKLMSQYQSSDDSRVALLNALRPFVKEQRYAKLDKAIQIAKLSRLIRMALELFRTKEDSHV